MAKKLEGYTYVRTYHCPEADVELLEVRCKRGEEYSEGGDQAADDGGEAGGARLAETHNQRGEQVREGHRDGEQQT